MDSLCVQPAIFPSIEGPVYCELAAAAAAAAGDALLFATMRLKEAPRGLRAFRDSD